MTMQVSQALEILGAKRVIWIDDRFNTTPAQLASLLTNSLETAIACEFAELKDVLATFDIDQGNALQSVTQILTDLPTARVEEIEAAFFAMEGHDNAFPTDELSTDTITTACQLLGVAKTDRWTFEKADRDLPGLCAAGDSELSYIVDLNEAGGSKVRGLDMLRALWNGQSKGTAFILTHETDIAGEGQKEVDLRADMGLAEGGVNPPGLGLPICVIAKERLSNAVGNADGMAEALKVGVKRAGLRRSLHEVLGRARTRLHTAIDNASISLLSVPPEILETHVFERGYKEGVSELHVVERAIAAHIGKEAREFFGTDEEVQKSLERLRALRSIPLIVAATAPDRHLAAFREAEVWESDELLNRALTPIACGDVFELDQGEQATRGSNQRFILLGQPCDISLRPEESKRAQDTAFFVPIKPKGQAGEKKEEKEKAPLLPFLLGGVQWGCDFRGASIVRLSILDLASFRLDGKVRIDEGHTAPPGLLVAQQKVYADRTAAITAALADPLLRPPAGMFSFILQLTFASIEAFKHIHSPVFVDSSKEKVDGVRITHPKRATWRLRRCGRIRMPYAAALLDQYTGVMSRHAFDLDFMSPGAEAKPVESKACPSDVTGAVVEDAATQVPGLGEALSAESSPLAHASPAVESKQAPRKAKSTGDPEGRDKA